MYYAKLIAAPTLDAFKVEIYSNENVKVKSFYALTLKEVKKFLNKYFSPVHGRTKSSITERYNDDHT